MARIPVLSRRNPVPTFEPARPRGGFLLLVMESGDTASCFRGPMKRMPNSP